MRPVSQKGFWAGLKKPIMALSPMDDVTDAAFRLLIARRGRPDVFYTEFVSVDGLCSAEGYPRLLKDLKYDASERPIVAQLFGDKPELFRRAAGLVSDLGFDGVDINMGCPVKAVVNTGSGASLIKTPELAQDIVSATIEGAGRMPVSVKTRIGYNRIESVEWCERLLETNPAAIIFHLRTKKEMSMVPAHWEEMPRLVETARGSGVLILGNGDIRTLDEAERKAAETGCDGIMLGRAIFGNPWLFNRAVGPNDITLADRFAAMIEHARLYEQMFTGEKNFLMMRKHLMAYGSGFPGAKEFRVSLEQINCAADVEAAIAAFSKLHGELLQLKQSELAK